jgi:hypothetical protein
MNKMEESLINLNTAKIAKEKGFSNYESIGKTICEKYKQCDSIINEECTCSIKSKYHNNKLLTLDSTGCYNKPNYGDFSAMTLVLEFPKQSMLQKWLREKHEIEIQILGKKNAYYLHIFKNELYSKYEYGYKTYEEALEEALYLSLTHIKIDGIS